MSLTVGELIGYLKLDGSQWKSGLDQAEIQLDGTVKKTESSASKMSGAFMSAGKAAATALTVAAGTATGLAISAFKGGVSYNALQQSSRAALTTILKGASAANKQMDQLDAFAKNSPFAKQVFISAQQQLLGFGLQAEKVIPALDAIQNSVAAVGGSNDDVANVTDALAKMLGQGKLAGDTLNRLGQYGIDAAGIIGKSMGMTGAQIREMASKPGGIPADQVWDVLVDGLQERFGGAAGNVKKTWAGATDRIKGAWRDLGSALAEPFVGHKGGGLAIEWVNKFADLLRAVEKKVGPLVMAILPKFNGTFASITPLLERATAAVKNMDPAKFAEGIDRIARFAPGVASVSASLLALGGNKLGLAKLGLSINPFVAGIVALVAASPEGRAALVDLLKALSPLIPVTADLAKLLTGSLTIGVQALAELVKALTPVISVLATGVESLTDGFKQLPGPVQGVVGAFVAAKIAGGLLSTEIGTKLTSRVADMVSSFKTSATSMEGNIGAWRDLTRELREANPALGGVQARIEALSTGRGVLADMSNAFMNAAVQAKRFPNAAGTAAAAMTGLKGAARGLLGVLGGPWVAGIGVAITALTMWINAKQEAKQRVQELTDAIVADSGALGENTREVVKNRLEKEGVLKAGQDLGLNLKDLTDAAMGNTDALARVKAALDGNIDAQKTWTVTGAGSVQIQGRLAGSADKVREALNGTNSEIKDATDSAKRLAAANGDTAETAQVSAVAQDVLRAGIDAVAGASSSGAGDVDGMRGAIAGLGGEAKSAKDQLKELKDMIDGFVGGERAIRADERAVRDAIRDAKDTAAEKAGANPKALAAQNTAAANLKRAEERLAAAKKSGKGILSAQQAVERAHESYAKATKRVRDTMKDATKAQDEYEAKMDSLGEKSERLISDQVTEGKSLEDIVTGYNKTRTALIEAANARGIFGKAAEKEADRFFLTREQLDLTIAKYGELRPEVVTKVVSKGGPEAIAQIELVKGTIDGVPRIVDIKIGVVAPGLQAAIKGISGALGPLALPFNVVNSIGGVTNRSKGGPTSTQTGPSPRRIPGHAWGTIIGPGTGVSDSILAQVQETGRFLAVSNGEFLSNAYATQKNRAALEAANHGATLTVADKSQRGTDLASIDALARAIGRELVAALPNAHLSVSAKDAAEAMWRRS